MKYYGIVEVAGFFMRIVIIHVVVGLYLLVERHTGTV